MRRFIFLVLVTALFAAAFVRWENGAGFFGRHAAVKFTPSTVPALNPSDVPIMAALDAEYTKLVQTVVPSVVSIATARHVRVPLVDPFDFFFGRHRVAERTENALGSGVVVSKEGHILTNHHVIANVDEIRVQFTDGRVLPAELIGSNEAVDIAVLHVNAPSLTPLSLGDSDQVKVGQMVFAVGNPFGLQETVTRGIISAKGRALHDSGVQFLQTDAAVNPGNSGGPLLNLRGEIIGINSSIYSQTGGWAGISFAIPSNTARTTLESLLKSGPALRGYLGANARDLTPELAQRLGVRDLQGALITEVVPGSPADQTGLKPGDIVRGFNGKPTPNAASFLKETEKAAVGSKVELDVVRGGTELAATMEVAENPATAGIVQQTPRPAPKPGAGEDASDPRKTQPVENVLSGVEVEEIPSSLRDGLPPNIHGVEVKQVQPNSPAAERLRVGDVIEEINSRPVRTPDDFAALARTLAPGERAMLYITRGQTRSFVVVTPGAHKPDDGSSSIDGRL